MAQYQTTPLRVLIALIAGALVGGSVIAITFLIDVLIWDDFRFSSQQGEIYTYAMLIATPVWFAGLLFLGGPLWMLLHGIGHRGWKTAISVGSILPFVVVFVSIYGFFERPSDWQAVLGWVPISVGAGVCVALTVWRIAYRRVV